MNNGRQIKNFIGTIKGEEVPLINSIDGLESVRVIETAYLSMYMDKWILVNGDEKMTTPHNNLNH